MQQHPGHMMWAPGGGAPQMGGAMQQGMQYGAVSARGCTPQQGTSQHHGATQQHTSQQQPAQGQHPQQMPFGMVVPPSMMGGGMCQPVMAPGMQPNVQYMQVVVPQQQAQQMQMAGAVPISTVSSAQASMIAAQQGQASVYVDGSQMAGSVGGRGGQAQQGGWGGFNSHDTGESTEQKDEQMDDWLSKRMGKKATTSSKSTSAAGSSSSAESSSKGGAQQSQLHAQPGSVPQEQQQQLRQQQMQWLQQQQQMQQQVQQTFQQQFMAQQQQYQAWQQQQQQQQQPQHQPQKGGWDPNSMWSQGQASGGDSPRTAAWRQQVAKAARQCGNDGEGVDSWITKRGGAGPARKAPSGAAADSQVKKNQPQPEMYAGPSMEAYRHLFKDERPWAEITDEEARNGVAFDGSGSPTHHKAPS